MSGIFVSHSSKDHPIAAEISAWLKQQGYASVFLDFDPSDGIPAGRNWAQELYRELKKCRAMLILCSEPSQASEWCFAEFFHAKAMGKAIIPIKIAPCAIRPLISELQVIDLTHNRAEGLERLGRGLREAGMEPDAGYNPDRPLYPGLAVFQEEDSPIFFGREAEIQECLDRLRKLREFGGYRLVLILGASGSGKSSLIRAGIIPRLKRAQAFWRIVGPVRPSLLAPGDDLDALTARFVPEFDRASGGQTVEMTPAACDPAAIVRQAGTAAGNDATPVLFIDQLEELLDKQLSQSADRFLKQLTDWLRSRNSRALAVATLRSDYLGEFQQHPAFRDIDFEKLTLGPLSRAGFEKVIEEPAKLVGLELEPGLVRTMLEATETGDALPLLAFTLGELWERHGGDGRLTVSEYRELGGLEGSVALAAEAVLNAEATTEEQRENLKNAFIPLVRMDHQKRYVRRLVRWSTIDRRFHAVLERFVAKRLLVSKSENGDRVLEVAHEALFRTWSRLEKWLDADLVNLRLWEGLRHAAREWEEGSRRGYLLNHRDSLLEDVEKLAAEPRFAIDPVERAYLDACIGLQKEKLRRELAEQRRLYGFIVFLVAAVIAVSYFGYLADLRRETAQRHLMSLHWVNGVFARDRGKDVLKAVHHFAAAAESADDALNKRNAYLAGALLTRGIHLASVIGHDLKLKSAVFGRDSKQVWTWDESGAGRAWDLSSGSIVKTAEFEGNPESIRTSPGGTWIIGQGIDGTVGIVDARSGQVILDTGQKRGWPVFSDDEGKLAGWDETGRVSIFDIAGNAETARFQAPFEPERMVLSVSGERLVLIGRRNGIHLWSGRHDTVVCHGPSGSGVVGAVISPNDSRMISWHSDGSAALWDIRNGCESIASLPGQAGHPSIIGALFNNDASTILIWNHSREGALSRWRAKTGEAVQFQSEVNPEFVASSSAIRKGILNKDESLLLTASDDGQAILWDVASSKAHRVFRHRAGVRGAVFDAGERRVLTWSDDGSARLWDIESGRAIGFPLAQGGQIRRAAFSEDGDRILTWGEDGMARIWLIEGRAQDANFSLSDAPLEIFWNEEQGTLSVLANRGSLNTWSEQGGSVESQRLADGIQGGRFDRHGNLILTRSRDHTVRLWNTRTARPLTHPLRHQDSVMGILGVGFGAGGPLLLSWGDDRTARLWNGGSGKLVQTFRHGAAVRGAVVNAAGTRVLTWSDERLVRLWDAQSGKRLRVLEHNHEVLGARFMENSSEILTWSSDGLIRGWNLNTGSEQRNVRHGNRLTGVVFSGDGSRMLSWAADGTARLWDFERCEKTTYPALSDASGFEGTALNHDGSRILTWSPSGDLRLWDSRTGLPLTEALRFGRPVVKASCSRDGARILAWSDDGSVRIWSLKAPPSQAKPVLQQMIRTGTRLNNQGELDVLDVGGWRALAGKSIDIVPARPE